MFDHSEYFIYAFSFTIKTTKHSSHLNIFADIAG